MVNEASITNLQQFSYYSGSQISIWFGDIWVDDIKYIRWQYNQEKRPIYGYASQHFDGVAKGQVILQGEFGINFRQQGYISYVMEQLPRLYRNLQTGRSAEENKDIWKSIRPVVSQHLRNGTFGPGILQEVTDLAKKPDFWEVAASYEEAIWGEESERSDKKKYIETADILQQNILPNGFNILVTYGDTQAADPQSLNDVMASTTKTLIGVHLLGTSQVIQTNGEPVEEAYAFMARDMDKYIGTSF
jgi:hypothetical protein